MYPENPKNTPAPKGLFPVQAPVKPIFIPSCKNGSLRREKFSEEGGSEGGRPLTRGALPPRSFLPLGYHSSGTASFLDTTNALRSAAFFMHSVSGARLR